MHQQTDVYLVHRLFAIYIGCGSVARKFHGLSPFSGNRIAVPGNAYAITKRLIQTMTWTDGLTRRSTDARTTLRSFFCSSYRFILSATRHRPLRAMQPQLDQNETGQSSPDRACSELLRAIVRPSVTDLEIRELAGNIHDWGETLRVAKQHRVVPMLFSRLTQADAPIPPQAQEQLQSEYRRNLFHCMANAAELIALLKVFEAQTIPIMPFKGVVLAASIYGDHTARTAGDLDLLVHPRDLQRATQLMIDRGYTLHTPTNADFSPANPDDCEYHFERRSDGMVAELRWKLELVWRRFEHDLGMDWGWPRRRTATLAGATVPDLDAETTLLLLCMHGSKHVWDRLGWIVDVAQLLASSPLLNWKRIELEARRTGLWPSLAFGVSLAHRVCGAPVPAPVLRRFESSSVRKLAEHIDANLFDSPGSRPPGSIPYIFRILGFRDQLRLLLSLDLFKPTERDRAAIALPRRLQVLYYIVRPLRLLFDRSPR